LLDPSHGRILSSCERASRSEFALCERGAQDLPPCHKMKWNLGKRAGPKRLGNAGSPTSDPQVPLGEHAARSSLAAAAPFTPRILNPGWESAPEPQVRRNGAPSPLVGSRVGRWVPVDLQPPAKPLTFKKVVTSCKGRLRVNALGEHAQQFSVDQFVKVGTTLDLLH
jgi:hypothetical protein